VDLALRPSEVSQVAFVISYISLALFFGWRIFFMKVFHQSEKKRAFSSAKDGTRENENVL